MPVKTDSYYETMEKHLCELIRIPSVKSSPLPNAPFGLQTLQALEYMLNLGSSFGFTTKNLDGYAGYIAFEAEKPLPYVAAVCHLDVVPAGDWENAFKAVITDDKIIGRGSIDDKGPAMCCLFALKALKDSGYKPAVTIRLVLGLDEESGSDCMEYYSANEPAPLAAFTADADFPVIFAEKGNLHFSFSKQRPTNESDLQSLVAGTKANVVPGYCTYTAKGQTHTVIGEPAHASTPWLGKNAISLAVQQLTTLPSINIERDSFINFFSKYFSATTDGSLLGIKCHDDLSGSLTCNAGVAELNPQAWSLECDIRYPVTFRSENIINVLEEVAAANECSFKVSSDSSPLIRDPSDPLVITLMDIYRQLTGEAEAKPIAIGGGTYARDVKNCIAFGPVFPGEECICHQTGEFARRDTLKKAMNIYAEAFFRLSKEDSLNPTAL